MSKTVHVHHFSLCGSNFQSIWRSFKSHVACCRITTKPSEGLGEDARRNVGARKLRAEHATVTSLFHAELLWNQGFHGELVKMGVFDTGIRPDHPHVKNIK